MSCDNEDVEELNQLISLSLSQSQHTKDDLQKNEDGIGLFGTVIDEDDVISLSDEFSEDEDFDFEIPPMSLSDSDIKKIRTSAPPKISVSDRETIDRCEDPHLKDLLLSNRTKGADLRDLWSMVKDLLTELDQELEPVVKRSKAKSDEPKKYIKHYKIGIPYFKSKDGFPCPRNPDAIAKYNKKQIFHFDMTPSICWNDVAIHRLIEGVKFQYRTNRVSEIQKEIRTLNDSESADKKTIEELKNRCEAVQQDKTSYPPLGSDKYIDWHKVSTKFLLEKFSLEDCRIFWHTYAHPSINKEQWKKEEIRKLTKIGKKYKRQNWEKIAAELGGNRTAYMACVKFFSSGERQNKLGKFSTEEDERLLDLIESQRSGTHIPWTQIARSFKGRTREQLFFRYTYFLKERENVLSGRFTEAEDVLILILVGRYGQAFSRCAMYVPHRSAMQIKARYTSNLKIPIKKFQFTVDDDVAILEHVESHGPCKWKLLGVKIHRSTQQVIQRYKLLKNFVKANPNTDIAEAPRRVRIGKSAEKGLDYLRIIADHFKNQERIPSLQEIKMLLNCEDIQPRLTSTSGRRGVNTRAIKELAKITEDETCMESPEAFELIDDLITDYFYEVEKEKAEQEIINECLPQLSDTVSELLNTLQANLHIPKYFESNPELDIVDKEIIKNLIEYQPINIHDEYVVKCDEKGINKAVPPNLHTLIGYRGLLALDDEFRSELAQSIDSSAPEGSNELQEEVNFCISSHVSKVLSPAIADKIMTDRDKFAMRLYSLFKFPMLMAEEPPGTVDETYNESIELSPSPEQSERLSQFECVFVKNEFNDTAGPKISMAERLKRKIDETLTSLSETPVKKSFYSQIELPRRSASIPNGTNFKQYAKDQLRKDKLKTLKVVPKDPLLFKTYSKKKAPETVVKVEDLDIDAPAHNAEDTLCEINVDSTSPFVTGSLETDLRELAALDDLLKLEKSSPGKSLIH